MPDARNSLLDLKPEVKEDKANYQHFMKNEPRVVDSSIEVDPETGFRAQYWKIGMVRNAKEENKKRIKVFLDPIPHMLVEHSKPLQGWYKSKFEPKGVRHRPCYTDALLTEPWGGSCPVMCRHCYIDHGQRGYRSQGLTVVPKNFGEDIRRQLKRMQTAAAGYFSSFTEPFQVLEPIYHNTQNGAQAFVDEGLPIFFLSRLQYPGWAYDLLHKSPYSYAQMSINTSDPNDWRRMSPRALSLQGMFDQVKSLHKSGIYVSIQVNPVLAGITSNDQIRALIHKLAECGADHLIFKFVEISFSSRIALVKILTQVFGGKRGEVFGNLLHCNIGGQVTIDEEYRIQALDEYKRECISAGVTMATCYEYAYERDADKKITSHTGISIGSKYLTADQCHGHRVPLFTRIDGKFQEVKECPSTGCLYCAEGSPGGKVPCGSDWYGSAPAWRLSDLKVGVYEDDRLAHRAETSDLVQIQKGKLSKTLLG
jgi:DNA repair photolyase